MKINIPNSVKFILEKLNNAGFSAFIVGGCVRDALLGLTPDDWDVCTSAEPHEIKKIFPKTIDTGIKHGTVTVIANGETIEVTTFRKDGDYKDNRHPETVAFTPSLEEDLSRRDFTVNAMAYNEKTGLVDLFGGINDLDKKIIKCVGDPEIRFTEDALRILRAVRFSAQKGFVIEENTLLAIKNLCALVNNLSVERIISEITKILVSDNPDKIKLLYETGVLEHIMPEMCRCFETQQNIKWHIYDVGMHSLVATSHVFPKPYLRFAALMHDWGKPKSRGLNPDGSDHFRNHAKESVVLAEEFLTKYKFSNLDKDRILRLIKHHDREIIPEKKCVRRALNIVGEDIFLDLLDLKRADCKAQNFTLTAPRMKTYEEIEALYYKIKEDGEAFSLKDLAVNGNDLMKLGFKGKEIGEILNALLSHVLDFPCNNNKEFLIGFATKQRKN